MTNDYSCPACKGTGATNRFDYKGMSLGSHWTCEKCGGRGRLPDRRGSSGNRRLSDRRRYEFSNRRKYI